jgi:hypothetical protein
MGIFITYGFTTARVLKWDANAGNYILHKEFAPPTEHWVVSSSTTSVNGGGGNASTGGCICAFSWARSVQNSTTPGVPSWCDPASATCSHQIRLDVFSMLTSKHYTAWESPMGDLQSSPQVSMHMGYVGLAHWGLHTHPANVTNDGQVLLFHFLQATPLWSYRTPGSMLDVDVLATEAGVYVVAGGGAQHATLKATAGGDAFAFRTHALQSRVLAR